VRKVDEERQYNVSIETFGEGVDSIDDDALTAFVGALRDVGAVGPVASVGGLGGGPGATFSLGMAGTESDAFARVASTAVEIFDTACEKMGITHGGVARLDILTEPYLELELEREPEEYAGVSEVAELFGVSRQRVSELRARDGFPEPIAELAAGPVWSVSSLKSFLASWPRKPGRPARKKAAAQGRS
jgi:hypothetical protein